MPLKEYHSKRDFKKTSEPKGRVKKSTKKQAKFVIQKHAASHLHFDFRLEIDGVLKSWAVPKGPSLDPTQKRLAVQTEDHPLEYAHFEGVIPEGEYGGGVIMIWDEGTFENLKSPQSLSESLESGLLEINLKGHRLTGGFALKCFREERGKKQWLLIKMKDEYADAHKDPVNTELRSVISNRSLDEIKKQIGH